MQVSMYTGAGRDPGRRAGEVQAAADEAAAAAEEGVGAAGEGGGRAADGDGDGERQADAAAAAAGAQGHGHPAHQARAAGHHQAAVAEGGLAGEGGCTRWSNYILLTNYLGMPPTRNEKTA